MKYLNEYFSRMVDPSGRTSQYDFWITMLWILLFNFGFSVVIVLIGSIIKLPELLRFITIALSIILFLSSISMQIRRLHDTDKSAMYLLIGLVPVVGQIIMIVFYATPGNPLPNQYGEPTKI